MADSHFARHFRPSYLNPRKACVCCEVPVVETERERLTYWGLCHDCYIVNIDIQHEARTAFCAAKRAGRILPAKRFKCVDCGKKARDWDHRDYKKPYDVEAVCRSCNQKRGPAKFHRSAA